MTVDVITFGCRLNTADGDHLRAAATAAGLSDTVVFNTCAVTAEAVRQARQTIRRVARERPTARLIVTGCAAQTEPATFSRMPEVSHVVGTGAVRSSKTWSDVAKTARNPPETPSDAPISVSDVFEPSADILRPSVARLSRTRAFLQVQNGCDHPCTFCVIPFGRGNSGSVPPDDVVREARALVEEGFSEIVLTGVDLTAYGFDLPGGIRLGTLVRRILREVPELPRLRLSSIDSIEVDPDVIRALAEEARLMPHLHLSLQSGDDLILKRMKRRHSRRDAVAFVEAVRRARPDVVFGADLIAGFPTETDQHFAESLSIVDDCSITHLHVFPFSPRPGTPAARMPPVADAVIRERAARLREAGRGALRRHLNARTGTHDKALMEKEDSGRLEGFATVRLAHGLARRGQILRVRVTGHADDTFLAEAA